MRLYEVCGGTSIASNDDYSGYQSQLDLDLDEGDSIYILWDDNYSSNSFNWTITVENLVDQTITFNSIDAKPYSTNTFDLAATSTSGLTVTYSSSDETVATISGNTVTIVGLGSTVITASQAGNNLYSAASSVDQTLTVTKADQTITFEALPSKTLVSGTFDLAATSTSGLAVTYSSSDETVATISGNTVTIVGLGSTVITASQAGNNLYNAASSVDQSLTVNKGEQVITFDALLSKTLSSGAFDLAATSTSGLTLTYTSSDETVATITGNTVTIVGLGSTVITASQAGNGTYNAASSVDQTLTVNKLDQTIAFEALPSRTFGASAFDLAATSTSGLAVTYTSSDETVATISGNTVTIVGGGSTIITASQAGNGTYNAASSVDQTLTVDRADQEITVEAIANKSSNDDSFDIVASTTSGLTLEYVVTGPATISGTTISLSGEGGTVTVTVSQVGNKAFNPASASESFDVSLVLAAKEDIKTEISVFPNPVGNVLTVNNAFIKEGTALWILDTKGVKVMESYVTQSVTQIEISNLAIGVYYLKVAGQKSTMKFIKE